MIRHTLRRNFLFLRSSVPRVGVRLFLFFIQPPFIDTQSARIFFCLAAKVRCCHCYVILFFKKLIFLKKFNWKIEINGTPELSSWKLEFQKLIQWNDRTHWNAQSTGSLVGAEKKNSGRNRKLRGERNHEKSEIVKKAERALPNESESVTQLTRSAPCLHVGLFVFPWRTHRAVRTRMRALFLSNFSLLQIELLKKLN